MGLEIWAFKMVVIQVAVAMFAIISSCTVHSTGNAHSNELKLYNIEHQPFAAFYKEMENLRSEQTTIRQQLDALNQSLASCKNEAATASGPTVGSTAIKPYPLLPGGEDDKLSPEDNDAKPRDPCNRYTVLDQPWRATNSTSKYKMCDRNINWKGWYRLYYNGQSLQMPERCVSKNMCGTHAPLWLVGPHPRRRNGIVTRRVCGHWDKNCCAFQSTPIKVKKCRGNYYVYQFVKPTSCALAYCADINTLVCGRCKRSESCVSKDKVTWKCEKKKVPPRKQVHFFATLPRVVSGKVNRIKYSTVRVNVGRAFNKKTGTFRAPVNGFYQFYFSSQNARGGGKTDLWLVVNGYWVSVSHTDVTSPSTVGSLNTYMVYLRRGSLVYVTQNCGSSWANAASSTIIFGGSLLAQR